MSFTKRYFLYAQHLSGTGHFVRTYEIACALAEENEVYLVDGGRPIPRPHSKSTNTLNWISLPRIYRSQKKLTPLESKETIDEIMEERKKKLLTSITQICPDVILIEHFPFSKWELYSEIIPMIQLAKTVNERVKVICSLRDIPGRMRHDSEEKLHYLKVIEVLNQYFQGILVHADPKIVQLPEFIPWIEQVSIPIEYTGYVSQKTTFEMPKKEEINHKNLGKVVVSVGGDGSINLISHCLAVWKHPQLKNFTEQHELIIFTPLFTPETDLQELYNKNNENTRIKIKHFTPDFLDYLQAATLSISQAGYNTCTNILETRTPAILIPNSKMSDQLPRSSRLAELGLVTLIDEEELNPDTLADAIDKTLSRPVMKHRIDLNGAKKTREILNSYLF